MKAKTTFAELARRAIQDAALRVLADPSADAQLVADAREALLRARPADDVPALVAQLKPGQVMALRAALLQIGPPTR